MQQRDCLPAMQSPGESRIYDCMSQFSAAYTTGAPGALEQLIKEQRANLISAHAVQQCLHQVLLYADDEDAVIHAEAAHVVAAMTSGLTELIRKSALASASLADAAGTRHMRKTPKQPTTAPSPERRKRIALPIVKIIAEARAERTRRAVRLLTQHPKRDR
jgi:hypothetical protein